MINKLFFQFIVIIMVVPFIFPHFVNSNEKDPLNLPVTFIGETEDWYVEHTMILNGSRNEYNTKINYKGEHDEILSGSTLYYEIITDLEGSYGGCFNFKNAKKFQSSNIPCGGCNNIHRETEVTCIIKYDDFQKEERINLKKKLQQR